MKKEMNGQVYILSRGIRTGKTTLLYNWLLTHKNAAGMLTPDVHNIRMLYDIGKKQYHTFEVSETYGGEKIAIGRFLFAKEAFIRGRDILLDALQRPPEWLVIDEAGKLEIEQGEGLEPAVAQVVRAYQSGQVNGKLLLVIRDTLLQKAIDKYGLSGAHILTDQLP